jgi:peptidoglycan/xylan/chitin deacetylase (PgdA/CDA1 family)
MYKTLLVFSTTFTLISNVSAAQDYLGFDYPNKATNAISITFDDARHSQVNTGLAILNKHKVKATFYISPFNVKEQLPQWQEVVATGHEIANHTSSHLCTGNFEWLRQQTLSLEQTSLQWLEKDILDAQRYITKHLGVTPRAFAYPCGNTFVGRSLETQSYVPLIAKHFDTGRTWLDETANNPNFTDFAQLTSLRIDGMTFEEVIAMLKQHRENNSWIILAGHEIGEKGQYTTDAAMLEKLIQYIKDPKNGYWLGTVSDIANYIKRRRKPI